MTTLAVRQRVWEQVTDPESDRARDAEIWLDNAFPQEEAQAPAEVAPAQAEAGAGKPAQGAETLAPPAPQYSCPLQST